MKTGQSAFTAAESTHLICEEEQNAAPEGWRGVGELRCQESLPVPDWPAY